MITVLGVVSVCFILYITLEAIPSRSKLMEENKRIKTELEEIEARERFLIARVRTLETRIK